MLLIAELFDSYILSEPFSMEDLAVPALADTSYEFKIFDVDSEVFGDF